MASSNLTGSINLATTNVFPIMLASPEALLTNQPFDMPRSFSIDLNITSSDAVGSITIFYQNDNPQSSTFTNSPIGVPYAISGGTFANGKTKQTIDSNGVISTKFAGISYTRTSGTGVIGIDGQITY